MRALVLFFLLAVALGVSAPLARATIFGSVRGIVHDPGHRPIAGATVTLKSAASSWSEITQTADDGGFTFNPVPLGDYELTVDHAGFESSKQTITIASDTSPLLHLPLRISAVNQTEVVSAQAEATRVDSVTPTTLLDRQDIARTPGANRTNSLQMITDYVPGSYYTHDQLHIRGGHQVSWLIDGVEIPNTNIASNLGPQIDPKDIEYLEVQRGSYGASYGDRTFGVFDVVPRNGFERNNEAELVMSLGNFYQTNDQINFGGHTSHFAYFTSLNGNRSNLGLQTPIEGTFHDAENGYGGFASFLYNANPRDQIRLVTSLRSDYYQIPYDPAPNTQFNSSGLRDGESEGDGYVIVSWVRTVNPDMFLTISPFFHYNSANYNGGRNDLPVSTTDDRASKYGGLEATVSASFRKNNVDAGVYGFGQSDNQLFGGIFNDRSNPNFHDRESRTGGLEEVFVNDKFKLTPWLTLMAGMRQTHFSGNIAENAVSPRFGVAFEIPHLDWVFRAFYGRYYQAPPLLTTSGPLLAFASNSNLSFVPLHGERDEEHQFGVTIPFHGWALDADTFETRAKNFFDHNNIGESNIFFPVTIDGAKIEAWELTLRSPRLWRRGQVHLAYSNQLAESRGAVTGGLICFPPTDPNCRPNPEYRPLDHDQRNTLTLGFDANLPWQAYASANVYYGSGFSNGSPNAQFPGSHLPQHTTFDLSLGRSFGERYTVAVTGLNVANRRVLLDNSLTFGGFHYNDPREIYVEFRYRFHY
ncbi:MAG TPA: TonB-dependent receptor [Verrucomicrobiae bacterium]|nr:TonB-dependent receptor [Verrucomicrobiae bacterium]